MLPRRQWIIWFPQAGLKITYTVLKMDFWDRSMQEPFLTYTSTNSIQWCRIWFPLSLLSWAHKQGINSVGTFTLTHCVTSSSGHVRRFSHCHMHIHTIPCLPWMLHVRKSSYVMVCICWQRLKLEMPQNQTVRHSPYPSQALKLEEPWLHIDIFLSDHNLAAIR